MPERQRQGGRWLVDKKLDSLAKKQVKAICSPLLLLGTPFTVSFYCRPVIDLRKEEGQLVEGRCQAYQVGMLPAATLRGSKDTEGGQRGTSVENAGPERCQGAWQRD